MDVLTFAQHAAAGLLLARHSPSSLGVTTVQCCITHSAYIHSWVYAVQLMWVNNADCSVRCTVPAPPAAVAAASNRSRHARGRAAAVPEAGEKSPAQAQEASLSAEAPMLDEEEDDLAELASSVDSESDAGQQHILERIAQGCSFTLLCVKLSRQCRQGSFLHNIAAIIISLDCQP